MQTTSSNRERTLIGGLSIWVPSERQTDEITSAEITYITNITQQYFTQNIAERLPNRLNPGLVYGVYHDYENDHMGAYRYTIGESIQPDTVMPEGIESLTIAAGSYASINGLLGEQYSGLTAMWQAFWRGEITFKHEVAYQYLFQTMATPPTNDTEVSIFFDQKVVKETR